MRIFKYPQDIDTGGSAYCIISAFPWALQLQKSVYNDSMYGSKEYRFHFLSYVPKELAYSNSPVYRGIKTLGVTSAVFGEGDTATSWGRAASEIGLNVTDNLLKGFAEMTGLDKAYDVTKEQISVGANLWSDPRLVNSFQEPDNVSQSFTYTLLANSLSDAKEIKLLVQTFKYAAQPERAASTAALPLLKSPLLFDIQVFTPEYKDENGKDIPDKSFSLIREFNWMNVTSCKAKPITDTSRVDVPFYIDGNVLGYDLTLDFKSIHPIVRPKTDADDDNDETIKNALKIVNGGGQANSQKDIRKLKVK